MAKKSWMWQNERTGGVQGATFDFETQQMIWYDEPGCGCAASGEVTQSCEEFSEAPAMAVPDDVLEEMEAAIAEVKVL